MKQREGGLENVPGFSFAALECGIKYENRLDFALLFSEKPCNAAGAFTTNKIFAAPVRLCRERIGKPVHGILVNANNANACTGDEGYRNVERLTRETASMLGVPENSLLAASTGVIGVQLPVKKMIAAISRFREKLSPAQGKLIPRAIMTTDTYPKECAFSFSCADREYTVAGAAKGVGMIAPNMATLLAFIITDMPARKSDLNAIFKRAVGASFNAITIDGDMSTNDTAIILSPISDSPVTSAEGLASFEEALMAVMTRLAELLVRDGEGATKYVTVSVSGAKNDDDARLAARAVSQSLLVKTALFGNDPNWGRIACAAGYSGAIIEERCLSIAINGITLLSRGIPVPFDKAAMSENLSQKDISITVELGMGNGNAVYYTSDISYEYVKINAEYTT